MYGNGNESVETKKKLIKYNFKKISKKLRLRVNRHLETSLLQIFYVNICCVCIQKVMSQREMIKTEVNPGDFLKSILNVGDFTRQLKTRYYIINVGDSRSILRN